MHSVRLARRPPDGSRGQSRGENDSGARDRRGTYGPEVRRTETIALSRPGSRSGFSFELGPRLRNLGGDPRAVFSRRTRLRRAAGPGRAGRSPGPFPGSAPAARSARPAARAGTKREHRPGRSPASPARARSSRRAFGSRAPGSGLRLPRAHPSVSRGSAAPAPRAPPPAPRRRRRCATCLQLGAHRARLRPGAPAAGEGPGLRAGPAL